MLLSRVTSHTPADQYLSGWWVNRLSRVGAVFLKLHYRRHFGISIARVTCRWLAAVKRTEPDSLAVDWLGRTRRKRLKKLVLVSAVTKSMVVESNGRRKRIVMAKTLSKVSKSKQAGSREVLQEQARNLMNRMSTPAAAVVARREEPSDYGDMSEQSHEEWLFLNRNAANAEQLRQIKEALQRINDGTYGVCADCEKPISPKRLQAVPWAKYCVQCQEQRGSWVN